MFGTSVGLAIDRGTNDGFGDLGDFIGSYFLTTFGLGSRLGNGGKR